MGSSAGTRGHSKAERQKNVLENPIISQNKKLLLSMLHLAGGSIGRYSRFQLGVYALKGSNLHSYKFEEKCSWGPADCQFHDDLEALCGYIEFDLYKSDKDHKLHGVYRLYKPIAEESKEYANEIKIKNPEKFKKLKEVANLLGKNPDKTTSEYLFKKFVKN